MKKKWYQNNVLIVALLVLFWPIGLVFAWKSTWKKQTKIIVTVIVFILFFLFSKAVTSSPSYKEGQKVGHQGQQINYQIIDKQENSAVENYKVLIKSGEDSKTVVDTVKKQCQKQCNIEVYNDRKALDLEKQYDDLISAQTAPQDLEAWKKQNYVYVADHLVGYMDFSTNSYQAYPFKDKLYQELKGN